MTQHTNTSLFRTCRWWPGGLGVVVSLVSIWASGWQGQQVVEPPAASAEGVLAESQEPIVPLPLHVPADPARVALGERLFHDVRLSGAQRHSVCHLSSAGTRRSRRAAARHGGHRHTASPEYPDDLQCGVQRGIQLGRRGAHTRSPRRARAAVAGLDAHHLACTPGQAPYGARLPGGLYDSVPWAPDTGPRPGRPGDLRCAPW